MESPKPHPHAELIKAWAVGAEIQYWDDGDNKWKDCKGYDGFPTWDVELQYRIKPEEPSNESWKPKEDEKYFFLHEDGQLDSTYFAITCKEDVGRIEYGNYFRTYMEAADAFDRVKAALKGATDVSANVGTNVGSELDGKPLSDGEKALIKALRRGRIFQQYVDPRAVVVEALKDGNMKIHHEFVAFCMYSNIDTARVRAAIKQIKAEQEANQ